MLVEDSQSASRKTKSEHKQPSPSARQRPNHCVPGSRRSHERLQRAAILAGEHLVETPGPLLPSAWLRSLPLPSGVDRAPSQEREMLSSVRKQ